MAILSKDIYDKKASWAAKRMSENKSISALNEEQHDALSTIASTRHNLHISSGGNPSRYDNEGYSKFFGTTYYDSKGEIYDLIEENNLPNFISYLKIDEFTYLGGDDWNEDEIDDYEENIDIDSDEYEEKYDAYLNIILNNVQKLDQSVRDYLAYIDYLYSTNYSPSGGDASLYIQKNKAEKMNKGGTIKKTTDGKKGGILYGKSHANGGIKAVVTDAGNKEVELEGGEAVVKKSALKDKTVKTLTGTNAQILNMINTRAGGNPIYAPSQVNMKNGGRVGGVDILSPYLENLKVNGIVLSDEDLVVLMYNEGKHKRSKGLYSPTILRKYLSGISEELANQLTIDLAMEFYDLFNEKDIPTYLKHTRIIIVNNTKVVFDNKKKMAQGGSVGSGNDFSDIESLIDKGIVEIEYERSTEKHAKEYQLNCKNPLYLKRIFVKKDYRLKGVGKRILKYLDFIAKKNSNDCIFGHISNKVSFTKDSRDADNDDVQLFKFWLHKNGYAINNDNNDFHKVISNEMAEGGSVGKLVTYKQKFNKKYGYTLNESHSLEEISKKTGVSMKGLQQIYNKGIGAYKTNPSSVRPNVKSKEQWAMARVYSSVMGGKASKVDYNELEMAEGGSVGEYDNQIELLKKAEKEYFDLNDFRVDENYDEDDVERNQRLVAIPKYSVSWESESSSEHIGYYDSVDEAIKEADTNTNNQERDLQSFNRVSLYFDVVWVGMDNYIQEEVEALVSLYDLENHEKYNLPDEIKNLDEELYTHDLSGSEDNAKELLSKVEDNLGDDISDEIEVEGYILKVEGHSGRKYSSINIIYNKDDEDFEIGSIKLRIADHAYNPRNNQIDSDFISVEVANENLTAERFHGIKSLQYDGDSDYDDIVSDVAERILEIVERWDIEEKINENTFQEGGNITQSEIGKMTKAEQKAFYKTKEGKALDKETYTKWKSLVNMSKGELESFYNSKEGKEAGLSAKEAKAEGIDSGRESARWIMKMKDIPYTKWTSKMWMWAKKQISFVSRMKGMRGDLYDDKGNKTRKHLALLIWGNNPKKMAEGGSVEDEFDYNSLYNFSDDDSTPTKEQREIENEKVVQEVINTLNKKIEGINLEIEDWSSRKYKSNKGVVYAGGDDIHGDAYTIGGINENRRRKRLESLHYLKLTTEKAIDIVKNYDVSRYGSFKDNIIEDFKNLRYTDKRGNKLHWRERNILDDAYDILINNAKKMAEGGNIEFSPEKKGTLIKGNEIIKYTEKANGNYRLVFYKIKESNGKVPIVCDAFDYCHKLDINDVSADELIDLIDKNNLMEQGGNVESNCISFIKNSEAIKNNGYFHYFKSTSIYADFGTKVPKVKSFYLCAYNSGGQKNLKVTDTLNLDLINKLQEIIGCEKSICKIIVDEFFRKAKRIESNDVNKMAGENIIVVDRDNIVCDNIKNEFSDGSNADIRFAEGGNVSEITFTSYKGEQIMFEPHNNEYFVIGNDENIFKSMQEAKQFIDNPKGAMNTEFAKMAAAETEELKKGIKVEQGGDIESNNNYLVDKIKDYNALNLNIKKSKKGSEIFSQIIKLSANQDVSIKQDSKNYKIKAIQGNGKKLTLKGSNTKSKDYTISDDDFDFAKELIISGVVDARNYDKNGMYNDFSRLSPTEVKKAVLDIQKCKKSIPASRLIEQLKEQYEDGYFKYKQGTGGFIQRERVAVDEVDIKPISPYESCDDSIFTDRKKEAEKGKKQIIELAIYDLAAMLNIVETEQEEKIISESIRDLYNLKQII